MGKRPKENHLIPQATIDLFRELWDSGLSTLKIAHRLDWPHGTVIGRRRRLGFPERPSPLAKNHAYTRRHTTAEQDLEIRQLFANGFSQAQISAQTNITKSVVRRALEDPNAGRGRGFGAGRKLAYGPPPPPKAAPPPKPAPAPKPPPALKKPKLPNQFPRKTTDEQEAEIRRIFALGRHTIGDLHRKFHLARSTLARILGHPNARSIPERTSYVPPLASEIAAAPLPVWVPRGVVEFGKSPCCWPEGHPGTKAFHFCEEPVLLGKPYCPEHCALAYRKRDDRENAA